jgi:hypothetical protein
MLAVPDDFPARVMELVAHIYDEDMPKPKFDAMEKPIVQAVLGNMAAQDPELLAAINAYNARQKPQRHSSNPIVDIAHTISTFAGALVGGAAIHINHAVSTVFNPNYGPKRKTTV